MTNLEEQFRAETVDDRQVHNSVTENEGERELFNCTLDWEPTVTTATVVSSPSHRSDPQISQVLRGLALNFDKPIAAGGTGTKRAQDDRRASRVFATQSPRGDQSRDFPFEAISSAAPSLRVQEQPP